MPLAALIDQKVYGIMFEVMMYFFQIFKKIFCCHGGIPPPWICSDLSAIQEIPVPLPLPELQSELAWNLMWNDPVRVSWGFYLKISINIVYVKSDNRSK